MKAHSVFYGCRFMIRLEAPGLCKSFAVSCRHHRKPSELSQTRHSFSFSLILINAIICFIGVLPVHIHPHKLRPFRRVLLVLETYLYVVLSVLDSRLSTVRELAYCHFSVRVALLQLVPKFYTLCQGFSARGTPLHCVVSSFFSAL